MIKQVFDYIDYFAEKLNIERKQDDLYYSAIRLLMEYCETNTVVLDNRAEIENFMHNLEIPSLHQNIFKILNPEVPIQEDMDISDYNFCKLSDTQLLGYMMYVFSTVSFVQKNELVCLKYNIIIWNTGFHNFAKIARGKIVNMKTREIVSYPFDKFFNIGEKPETKEELVRECLEKSTYVYVTEKKDGSLVSISRYNNDLLITTNGSFENYQTEWSMQILKEKYSDFFEKAEQGYTYIFELIHPENRIVVDYFGEKDLYLLAVRDLSTHKLLSLPQIHSIANKYGFPYPEVYDFNNLDDILHLAKTLSGANKEGWVFRIGLPDGTEKMVKIKLEEYFAMHSAIDKIRLSFVYRHLLANDLDDFFAVANAEQKKKIDEKVALVQEIRDKITTNAKALADEYLEKHCLTYANYTEDREKMIAFITDLLKHKSPFTPLAVDYVKRQEEFSTHLLRMNISNMKKYCKILGYDYNE